MTRAFTFLKGFCGLRLTPFYANATQENRECFIVAVRLTRYKWYEFKRTWTKQANSNKQTGQKQKPKKTATSKQTTLRETLKEKRKKKEKQKRRTRGQYIDRDDLQILHARLFFLKVHYWQTTDTDS